MSRRDRAPEPDTRPPSKSARKRAAHAAQELGEALIALREAELAALALPEELDAALRAARHITSRAALARQRQYIGKLMPQVELEPLRAALAARSTPRPLSRAAQQVRYNAPMKPLVGIIMGSSSDWETMQAAAELLDPLGGAGRTCRE